MLKRVTLMTANSLALVFPVVALLTDRLLGERIQLEGQAYLGAALTLLGAVAIGLRRGGD
jgi:hypothetical protein